MKLSVVLATRNEEENIARCIKSVKAIADEVIIYDEYSTDKTKQIAEELGAKVYLEPHHDNFHTTKQKALEKAKSEWILQMDADEAITKNLANEIEKVINMSEKERLDYNSNVLLNKLFQRHQVEIEKRDGKIGNNNDEIVAYFIPRLNMFLGKPLIHAGVYPDPAIRLVKKDKAWFPAKSVHEIMQIGGKVGWLKNYMEHYDSPTLSRYFKRLNRYTDLQAESIKISKGPFSIIYYVFYKPSLVFLMLFLRHKGFMDGVNGFLWSMFSAWHYPIAYFKYVTNSIIRHD